MRSNSAEDFERIASEVAANTRPDQAYLLSKSRLPVDSPYVGSFHRGFKLCKRKFLHDTCQRDLELARCPYIDHTMFDVPLLTLSSVNPISICVIPSEPLLCPSSPSPPRPPPMMLARSRAGADDASITPVA